MTNWADRISQRAGQPAQPDTSHFTLAAQNAEIDPTEQDSSPFAMLARRQAQHGVPITPPPASFVPKVIGPAWTPPPGWIHTGNGWNPAGTPEGVRTPMPAGYETYRRDGSSTNTPFQLSPQQRGGVLSQQIRQMNPIMGGVKNEIRQPVHMQSGVNGNLWNNIFNQVNGFPINNRWDQAGQQAYMRRIAESDPGQSRYNNTQPVGIFNPTIRNDLDTPEKELAYRMSRGLMPNTTQQALNSGAQQNQQQQLMALLSLLFNRG